MPETPEHSNAATTARRWFARVRMRLSTQLALSFLLVSLLPMALVTWLNYHASEKMLREQVSASLDEAAHRQANQIENYLEERIEDVRFMAGVSDVRRALVAHAELGSTDPEAFPREVSLLAEQLLGGDDSRGVALVDKLGLVAQTFGDISPDRADGISEIFRKTMTTLEPLVIGIATGDGMGQDLLISAPVMNGNSFAGCVVLQMQSSEIFYKLIDNTIVGKTGETVVSTEDGANVLILNNPRNAPPTIGPIELLDAHESESPTAQSAFGGDGIGSLVDYRGVPVVAAWHHIPIVRWGVVVKIDADEALGPVRQLRILSTIVAFVTATVVVFLAFIFSRTLTNPLRELTEAAKDISRGDLRIHPQSAGSREVSQLAEAFAQMTARLSDTIGDLTRTTREREQAAREAQQAKQELEEINHTLEEKVADRTGELSNKNGTLEQTLQELKKTQGQLIMQEKMASLGQLTAGIAHEIKNPLNFVTNLSSLSRELGQELRQVLEPHFDKFDAKTRTEVDELLTDIGDGLERVADHGRRADSIVRGMLLHSRGESRELMSTDLNQLLKEYVNLAYHGMRARDKTMYIKLVWDLEEGVPPVRIVPQDIGRVILNVATNACHALRSAAKSKPEDWFPEIRVSSRVTSGKVELRIRDNGPGIAQSDLDMIFQPFYTTKPAGEGTGLGLSISYQIIVKEHFGEMLVYTEPGNYTEFLVILPAERPVSRVDIPKLSDIKIQ